jgi:hypothetical protein
MNNLITRILITLFALGGIIVHGWTPAIVVDAVTLGLVVVAVVPWLAPIVKSVELPGGFKFELKEVERKVEELKGATESASRKAETALSFSGMSATTRQAAFPKNAVSEPEVLELAAQYNEIRRTQASGWSRTQAMADLFGEMISAAAALPHYDISAGLADGDRGKRLFAYAFLYARLDFTKLNELVHSITSVEDKAFGQYWGIQALRKVIASRGSSAVGEDTKEDLRTFLKKLEPGTDRYYDLSHVLDGL